ncbi:MAG: hypothetical protein IPK97_07895 [Ahniella sp.]|nr:hypothetical protein [Ahniella sp.]
MTAGARTSKSFTVSVVSPDPSLNFGLATVTSENGIIEPQECNTLDVAISNAGGATANVVNAVLSSSTPGVTIAQANSGYPAIPSGESRTNDTDYEVGTDGTIACGAVASFTHTVTYQGAGAPTVLNFNLPIGQPAATNYTFASETGASAPVGVTFVAGSQDDDSIVTVTLPASFNFSIYGTPLTQLRADTNGVLIFNAGSATSTATNGGLPVSAYSAPALFALWDDLDMSTTVVSGGGIYTQVNGTAPNRTFDIQWRARRWQNGAATPTIPSMDFTVRLHETNNRIELFYATVTGNGGGGSGASATIGVQGAGTGSVFTLFSNGTASVSIGSKITATRAPAICTVGPGTCGALPNNVFANGFE